MSISKAIDLLHEANFALQEALRQYNAGKEALQKAPLEDMGRAFIKLKQAHDSVEEGREAINKELEFMSRSHVPERLALAQVPNITITVGNRDYLLYKGLRWSASMLKKEEAIAYLKNGDVNMRALVKEEVNAKTLASFAKDFVEKQARELPDDLFKVGQVPYTAVRAK